MYCYPHLRDPIFPFIITKHVRQMWDGHMSGTHEKPTKQQRPEIRQHKGHSVAHYVNDMRDQNCRATTKSVMQERLWDDIIKELATKS